MLGPPVNPKEVTSRLRRSRGHHACRSCLWPIYPGEVYFFDDHGEPSKSSYGKGEIVRCRFCQSVRFTVRVEDYMDHVEFLSALWLHFHFRAAAELGQAPMVSFVEMEAQRGEEWKRVAPRIEEYRLHRACLYADRQQKKRGENDGSRS